MGKPYSIDLRERVVAAVVKGGLSCHGAAEHLGVGVKTAITWVRRLRETGSVAHGRMGGHKPKAIAGEHRAWLLERTKQDFTLRGLVAELAARGLAVDYRSVWEFVHAEKLSFKKSLVAGERDRPDVARRGERLIAKVPHGHWNTTTFVAALRHDRIEAPWLLEGQIDGESFRTYVERVLVPTLRPGDIVVMDNLGSHKGKAVRALIRAAGAKLFFLPKYSPDLNPIEQVFAKLKHLLRKAAARTVETICAAIGQILGAFTPEECANYFRNSGSAPT